MRYLAIIIMPFMAQLHIAHADDRPNVIIIFADDLGYGDLSCYGHPTFQTPNLDKMAREGAKMTHFYVPCPYCAPSRAALQTGRYPFRSGMTRNPFPKEDPGGGGRADGDTIGLPNSEITLGEAFQKAGYRTCCIGKWHLGHQPRYYPTRNGYHHYLGILYSNDMHPVRLFRDEAVIEYPVVQATLTRRYTDRATEFIKRNAHRPFFLYLPHAMPHKPLACSEEFYQKSGNGLYADTIAELDHEVGRLMKTLKDEGLDEKTLVIFTSDNGPWYGGSTGGLRGMKGRTFEGGIRVPLIARWPGKIPPGHLSDQPAIVMDLFTTSLKACGIPIPDDRRIDGRDLMPLWTGEAKSPHDHLLAMRGEQIRTVRAGKWKFHALPPGPVREKQWSPEDEWIDPRRPNGVTLLAPYEQAHPSEFPGVMTGDPVRKIALFDLEADPAEQHNVAEDHPEIVSRLRKLIEQAEATREDRQDRRE